ncbi:MAG: type II toxin-antitoxin system HicA family toxin [bacterium]|nr:type II toxin-antitoxin system HicA family toxin [bacterium]
MKRRDVIRYLLKEGCVFDREGARHSVFFNPRMKLTSSVPRHPEIDGNLFKKILKDLGIDKKNRK